MKSMNSKRGFTLIELLIVIAIIGVLAVAFLPSLLGAPAKGRDTSRIADLQKIQKVLINGNLESKAYPATGCVANGFGGGDASYYLTAFGGTLPKDPQTGNQLKNGANVLCTGQYYYVLNPSASYKFGLYAHVENANVANSKCDSALTGTITPPAVNEPPDNLCYAILTQ